jgi:hypothetical protein
MWSESVNMKTLSTSSVAFEVPAIDTVPNANKNTVPKKEFFNNFIILNFLKPT